jgi:hypothetical protein
MFDQYMDRMKGTTACSIQEDLLLSEVLNKTRRGDLKLMK